MKDLIAKLKSDATCAIGAIWLHIDAQAARIAELEQRLLLAAEKFMTEDDPKPSDLQAAILALPLPDTSCRDIEKEDLTDLLIAAADLAASTALQAPVREVPGWQPIETAPKDGTHILLWWGEQARLGWWLDNSHTRTPWAGWKVPSLQVVPFGCQPSHWMPMPAAPVQKEGE